MVHCGFWAQNYSRIGKVDGHGGQNRRSVGRIEMHRKIQREKTIGREYEKTGNV